MKRERIILMICVALAGASVASSQAPVPRPAPPPPPAAPVVAPVPPVAPAAPFWRDEVDAVRAQVEDLNFDIDTDSIRESVREQMAVVRGKFGLDHGLAFMPQPSPKPRGPGRHEDDDRTYQRGQRALDGRNWEDALQSFTQVAGGGGSRADGALYWKAYTLAKLGRRDEGVAAIAELRKSYSTSRWLDDAKALELELKQASGQKVTPEAESDEDLKLMAINGLMQSDPERAQPLLENLLKTSTSPKLKERALFVLAQSNSPRGKQALEQVARGGAGNPDLQLKAISYISANSKTTDNRQLLWEIYSGSNDTQVKRAVVKGLMSSRDKDHLLQIARTDKSPELRQEAIAYLGSSGAQTELWQIYQGETSPEVKQQILRSMISSGSVDRLAEIAKTEKDPKVRRSAIHALGSMNATRTGDTLASLYAPETDPAMKRNIIDSLHSQRNAKALVDLARKESDPAMKREIVHRLSNMKSKEAADYLMELLK